MTDFIVVLVTAGSVDEAERIAAALVDEQLVACVNVVGPIRSIYRWEGQVQRDDEHMLMMKTRSALFEALAARVGALHSYQTPEIIALPITAGSEAYLAWLTAATRSPS